MVLEKKPLDYILDSRVKYFCDYSISLKKNLISGDSENIILPKSNVIEFESDDGCKIILRPSGTEPKIKMYISVNEALNNVNEFEKVDKILNDRIDRIIKSIGLWIQTTLIEFLDMRGYIKNTLY